ncbi:Atp10p ASCRUDRAFT_27776, partial [Ascoidea rubescens DSM 1968]
FVSSLKSIKDSTPGQFKVLAVDKPIGQIKAPKIEENKKLENLTVNQFFDKDKKKLEREDIMKEIKNSEIYDLHVFRKTNGKIFKSPISYFKREKALYFPNIYGESLSNQDVCTTSLLKGQISIVRVYSSVIGDEVTQTYFRFINENENSKNDTFLNKSTYETVFKNEYPNCQIVDLSIYNSALKKLLINLINKRIIKKSLPEERWNKYLLVNKKNFTTAIAADLWLKNFVTGYIYLVDDECKIRYACCGNPSDGEYKSLWKAVKGLENELA